MNTNIKSIAISGVAITMTAVAYGYVQFILSAASIS
jgi:hypothetical protein